MQLEFRNIYLPMIKHELNTESYRQDALGRGAALLVYLHNTDLNSIPAGSAREWMDVPGELIDMLTYLEIPHDYGGDSRGQMRWPYPAGRRHRIIDMPISKEHKRLIVLAMALGY